MYEEQTYELILDRILARMPDTLDTRQSSFLYNATAPIAVELQNVYLALDNILNITFFDTSDREGKLQRCKERGINTEQFAATRAICVLEITPTTLDIPIGTRFNYNDINYTVTEKISDGVFHVRCDSYGTMGNVTGQVTPIDYINGLETAEITDVYQWGEDEADVSLIDEIYYASLNSQAFGGNRADYMQKVKSIAGIGGVKVYTGAEWKGGGTVRIVFTTSAYTKPADSFVDTIQTMIDPLQNQGEGYGIAPVGHTVTVEAASEVICNISFTLTLQSGYTWADIESYVNAAIDEYLKSLNEKWESESNIIVRISQIETRILDVSGVVDITGTAINGNESNLTISKDSIAVRGSVNATT